MTPLDQARNKMLSEQLLDRGITSPSVLAAIARVPRERFVPAGLQDEAYADRALPIECEQTISQPYIVGLMTQALELTGNERVLEVGAGSGYQTAILAELAKEIISIERHAELAEQARRRLAELGYNNFTLLIGDGTQGWPAGAPYDRIIVAAAGHDLPPALFEQLREGGILVIPLGDGDAQSLKAIRKRDGQPHSADLSGCRFVPLVASS